MRTRAGGCLLVLALIPLAFYGSYLVVRGPLPSEPQLIAHRGGTVDRPENTLAAFAHAVEVGADWIEMDVQRTQDGALVVIHDETVDRTTDGAGRVQDMTLAEMRGLDAGHGELVPTFDEAIEFARAAGVRILPEAKLPELYPGIEADMVNALDEGGFAEGAVIQSFDHDTLESIRGLNPDIQVCPVYGLGKLRHGHVYPEDATVLCQMAEMAILNPWMIRQAHADGREVFVWFGAPEHPLVMRLVLALGVDGVMTDDPAALAKILDR